MRRTPIPTVSRTRLRKEHRQGTASGVRNSTITVTHPITPLPPPHPVLFQTTLMLRPTTQHPTHRPHRTAVLAAPATARKPAPLPSQRPADRRKSPPRRQVKGASCGAGEAPPATAPAHVLRRAWAPKLGAPCYGRSAVAFLGRKRTRRDWRSGATPRSKMFEEKCAKVLTFFCLGPAAVSYFKD